MHSLADLATRAGLRGIDPWYSALAITGVTADSRQVRPGFLFVAISGAQHDGSAYIADAVRKGAAAVLAPTGTVWPDHVRRRPILFTEKPRQALARIAAAFAGARPKSIVAVTGTNGKTSTVDFLRQLWVLAGYKAASLGTLGIISQSPRPLGGGETQAGRAPQMPQLGMTTPDPVALADMLARLAESGIQHAALEASSHGLDQYRLDGVRLAAAGFTNLTRDHLDYHKNFAAYRAAKLRLFADLLPARAVAVANADMDRDTLDALRDICARQKRELLTVGEAGEFFRLLAATPMPHGQALQIDFGGTIRTVETALPGRFQADNALMAACLAHATGVPNALDDLPKLHGVRGRMELAATLPNGAAAYVDYAHTPDALQRVLTALRPHAGSHRIVCVFGAGGDRDPGKRPLMGQEVFKNADLAIVTDDNPRSENPAIIRGGILGACPDAMEIGDRARAIETGLSMLKPGDVLVVAGKGHEQGQTIGRQTFPFDDASTIRRLAGVA
jgi:UDP-N-acetylmuramoyl-L-alanyl-D-glutamate--2,6-diaminopimelate ligase